jgi:hypothetical protein
MPRARSGFKARLALAARFSRRVKGSSCFREGHCRRGLQPRLVPVPTPPCPACLLSLAHAFGTERGAGHVLIMRSAQQSQIIHACFPTTGERPLVIALQSRTCFATPAARALECALVAIALGHNASNLGGDIAVHRLAALRTRMGRPAELLRFESRDPVPQRALEYRGDVAGGWSRPGTRVTV